LGRRIRRRAAPFGFASHEHNSDTFIDLLDLIDAVYPPGSGHIVMDNLSAHDTPDVNEWFDEHPGGTRHFTPKHASWLNQIELHPGSSRSLTRLLHIDR
jgi:transposase